MKWMVGIGLHFGGNEPGGVLSGSRSLLLIGELGLELGWGLSRLQGSELRQAVG